MAWKPKKKAKPLSYAEQQFVKKLVEDSKTKHKTWRGYAVLDYDGAKAGLKISGSWRDIDELKQCADEFAETLRKASSKKWKVVEVVDVNAVYDEQQ